MLNHYKIPQSVLIVVYTVDLQVLLLNRVDGLGWQSVTGSKDSLDEPSIEAAKRELKEETGLSIGKNIPLAALHDWHYQVEFEIFPSSLPRYEPGVRYNLESWFGLQIKTPCSITLSKKEHSEYVWLPYEKAAQHCFSPSNAEAILQLPKRLQ